MKLFSRALLLASAISLAAALAMAAAPPKTSTARDIPPFPGTLVNARYVYVTSYDGDQFDVNLLPEDREAIGAVQDALQKWGKFTLVYQANQADIVLMVTGRPSEDILAVYDAHGWPGNGQYLWRMTGRKGLQASETPLLTEMEQAFELAKTKH
jgi:predicted Zn-dependent protease